MDPKLREGQGCASEGQVIGMARVSGAVLGLTVGSLSAQYGANLHQMVPGPDLGGARRQIDRDLRPVSAKSAGVWGKGRVAELWGWGVAWGYQLPGRSQELSAPSALTHPA